MEKENTFTEQDLYSLISKLTTIIDKVDSSDENNK